jgi:ABC-type transporter Mla subunit MlaD
MALFKPPFQRGEFVRQCWFLAKVSAVPLILISIPFGMIIALHVGTFARELGAEANVGSAMLLAVIREHAPVATALLIAGAGRSIDEGARAAETFRATLDDQVAGNRNLSRLAESLGEVGTDFNRLGRELEHGMPTLSDNEAEIVRLLDELRGFSGVLDRTLRVTRRDLDRMIVHGDSIMRLLFDWRVQLAQIFPSGMTTYGSGFSTEGFTHPGFPGQAGYFAIIIDTHINELCDEFPPEFAENLPGCGVRPGSAPGAGAQSQGPTVPDPADRLLELIRPDTPERLGVDELLRRTLGLPGGERG